MGNFKEDIGNIRAFVFDVDGVFTNGGITIDNSGDFTRTYNAKDGYAISYALRVGYPVCIITGGRGKSLEIRFKMLGVTRVHIYCMNKIEKLKEFMDEFDLRPEEVLFMGDDIPDIEAMRHVGMAVCPADAVSEVIEVSRYVSQYKGGEGCVRDVVEQVLRARGDWAKDSMGVSMIPSA